MTQDIGHILSAYNEAVSDGDREQAMALIDNAVAAGIRPEEIVFQVVIPAIGQMTKQIAEDPDASLAQNFLMARIGAAVTEKMVKKFAAPPPAAGRVILGTAMGDMHSLGKTIVGGCLKSLMFDVIDVGISVSPEQFVEEALAWNAQVIGVSSMMTHTALGENGSLGVRRILRERNLERRIKLVVGGAPYLFDPLLYRAAQADGWAPDGVSAGKVIGDLIEGIEK